MKQLWRWFRSAAPVDSSARLQDRVYADWAALVALEQPARHLREGLLAGTARSVLAGRHRAHLRGRGVDFEELRHYLPGDDARAMDWRVTARKGTPHVRVYNEERDRTHWLVVDQRMSMFFARSGSMRSVVAAQAAALWGWSALAHGDRVGGWVVSDDGSEHGAPQRGRRAVLQWLARLAHHNQRLRADTDGPAGPQQLEQALWRLAALKPRASQVVVFSSFEGLGEGMRDVLLALTQHNQVTLMPVWDAPAAPVVHAVPVSDGHWQVELQMQQAPVRTSLQQLQHTRQQAVLALRDDIGVAVLPLRTDEPVAQQLNRRDASGWLTPAGERADAGF